LASTFTSCLRESNIETDIKRHTHQHTKLFPLLSVMMLVKHPTNPFMITIISKHHCMFVSLSSVKVEGESCLVC